MAVGATITQSQINADAAQLSRGIEVWCQGVAVVQTYLVATPDTDLEALGFLPNDVALLKSAFGDLQKLANIYAGKDTVSPAYDFGTFSRQMSGLLLPT